MQHNMVHTIGGRVHRIGYVVVYSYDIHSDFWYATSCVRRYCGQP